VYCVEAKEPERQRRLKMALIYVRTKFMVAYILMILMMMPGIQVRQARHKERPLWISSYNGQANVKSVIRRPAVPSAFYNPYPYIFSGVLNNLRWKPYISNFQSQNDKQPIAFDNRWLKPGNPIRIGITNNVPNVPIVAFLPGSSQIQQAQNDKQDALPPDTMTVSIKEEQSSLMNDYISMKESPPPQTQEEEEEEEEEAEEERDEEDPQEKLLTEIDPGLPANDDLNRLIEQALQNGELLNQDEWFKKHTATKKKQRPGRRENQEPGALKGNDIDEGPRDPDAMLLDSPVCDNTTFCEHPVNYPEELVNRAIRDNDNLKLLLQNTQSTSDVEERFDFEDSDDWPLCRSFERTIYPRLAKTARHNWLYVVNQDNFQQGIRVEFCVNEGSVCKDLEDYVPEGYKIYCKQNYLIRQLVAVQTDGTIGKDDFKIPASCCCHRDFVGPE